MFPLRFRTATRQHRLRVNRKNTRCRQRRFRLRAEPLEGRRLLATFTVSTLADSGAGSLRDVIGQANGSPGADEIGFETALEGGTIQLSGGQITISSELNIRADNLSAGVTIDASASDATPGVNDGMGSRIFTITDGPVTVNNLTLTGGDVAGNGGAIESLDRLILRDSTVSGNHATSSGGGVYQQTYDLGEPDLDPLKVYGSSINNNSAQNGGGIYGAGYLYSSDISYNYATVNGGGIYAPIESAYPVTVVDLTISYNEANTGKGGGISAYFENPYDFTLDNSTISGNQAGSDGGGAYVYSPGSIYISESTVANNTSSAGDGGGVAVVLQSNADLFIDTSTLTGNQAVRGGCLNVLGELPSTGTRSVEITNSTCSSNTAMSLPGVPAGGGLNGIGIENISIYGSEFSNNYTPGSGGGILFAQYNGDFTVSESTISGNSAGGNGGGVYGYNVGPEADANIYGSYIYDNSASYVGGGMLLRAAFGSYIALHDSTVSSNDGAAGGGAAVYADSGSTQIRWTESTISGNSAADSGGGLLLAASFNGTLEVQNSTISGNIAQRGGGVKVDSVGANVSFYEATIADNVTYDVSGAVGAGIYAYGNGPPVNLYQTLIADNLRYGTTEDDVAGSLGVHAQYSLIETNSSGAVITGNNNLFNMDPLLGPLANNGGPTPTHALLPGSPAIDAGNPSAIAGVGNTPVFDQRGFGRVEEGNGDQTPIIDIGAFEVQGTGDVAGDFDGDGDLDIDDIDALVMEIVAGTNDPMFDLTGDGLVDLNDITDAQVGWLRQAGELNLGPGKSYLEADANLDGVVDGLDFFVFNANKFQETGKWSQHDLNADGVTDGLDFIIWNSLKFTSSCPERPASRPPADHARLTSPSVDTDRAAPQQRPAAEIARRPFEPLAEQQAHASVGMAPVPRRAAQLSPLFGARETATNCAATGPASQPPAFSCDLVGLRLLVDAPVAKALSE